MSDIESMLSELRACLDGNHGDDQARIARTGLQVVTTLLQKNRDYGSSVFSVPQFTPGLDPGVAILVRLSDKVARFSNPNVLCVPETREETMKDFAGYSILYLSRPEGGGGE